jgi:hypothetical protein
MEWLFGKRLTPEEMLRRNQRSLNKAIRDLDRERMKMEQQEKKIIADIKKMAKDNQMVKISTKFVFQLSYKSKLLCSLQIFSYFTVFFINILLI